MNKPFKVLKSEIDREIQQLEKLIREKNEIRGKHNTSPNSTMVRALASITHDFYTGIEQNLKRLLLKWKGTYPRGIGGTVVYSGEWQRILTRYDRPLFHGH